MVVCNATTTKQGLHWTLSAQRLQCGIMTSAGKNHLLCQRQCIVIQDKHMCLVQDNSSACLRCQAGQWLHNQGLEAISAAADWQSGEL
jgi:hypothetical protein